MKIVAVLVFLSMAAFAALNLITMTVLPEDDSFIELPFSGELLELVPDWSTGYIEFDLPSWEPYTKDYLFSNGVLTIKGHGTEGFIRIFTPSVPVLEEDALLAAEVIALGNMPGFVERDEVAVVHEECDPSGAGCRLILNLNEEGLVESLFFIEWSP